MAADNSSVSLASASGSKALRRWRSAVLALTTLWLAAGCNPITVGEFMLMPWVDTKLPPRCKLAAKDKEVTVVLLTSFANLETRPEILSGEYELPELLAQHMRKAFAENKEKINVVPPGRVKSFVNKNPTDPFLAYEVGKHFKADYVIRLEIHNLALYEKNSFNQLFRGNAEIAVNVLDVTKPRGEGTIFDDIFRSEFPRTGPRDASGSSPAQFRALFLSRLARDLTRWFTAYPAEKRHDMD